MRFVARWLVVCAVVYATDAVAERLPVRTYTTADGLANGRVFHATHDRGGFLWFATNDGISRFDGNRFESFGVADGLPDPNCLAVIAASDGRLWVATERGLAYVDLDVRASRVHFTAVHLARDQRADMVSAMFEDSHHQLWLASEAGLWRVDRRDQPELVPLREGRQPAVYAFAEDRGTLWLGTSRGLLHRLADGTVEHYRYRPAGTPDDRTISVHLDRAGRLWVGGVGEGPIALIPPAPGTRLLADDDDSLVSAATRNGAAHAADSAVRLPRAPGEIRHYGPDDGYPVDAVRRGIFEDSRGTLWLGGEHLVAFDGTRFRTLGRAQGLPEDSMAPLIEDTAGNVWFGGIAAGVSRLAPHGLVTYDALDGLDADRIVSIVEDRAGTVIAISERDGHTLERLAGDHFLPTHPKPPAGVETIGAWSWNQVGFFDRDDRWWQATQSGLDHYPHVDRIDGLATATPERFTLGQGLPGRDIFRLFEDRQGDVWISTLSDVGLARWDHVTNRVAAITLPGLPHASATAFAEDPAGALWIGYDDGALARVRSGGLRVLGADDAWTARSIDALLVDHLGRLWVATSDGVARIEDPTAERLRITRYTAATGLSTDRTTALVEDLEGRVYVGTVRGVDRIDPSSNQIGHLTIADGLPSDFINAAHRDRTGTVWFATHRGVARLTPFVEPAPVAPPVYLTSVKAAGEHVTIAVGGERAAPALVLDHGDGNLDLEFTSPSFAADVPVLFQYRLEGTDDGWSALSREREIHYAHLAPGRYRFAVRASRGGAVSAAATLELEVLTPIWRRTWFILTVLLVAAAAAWRIYRWRVEHLVAVERVRTRIAQDMHDDLGASLSRISILSEVAGRRVDGTGDGSLGEIVGVIGRSARELVDAASDIVWSTDPRRDDLESLVIRVRGFAGDVLEARDIAWRLDTPTEPGQIKLDPDERRHLYLVIKEAVSNAARHSNASHVTIAIREHDGGLETIIADDGCGIAVDAVPTGNGLANMRERAREAGGVITIAHAPGGGTRVAFRLPLRG
ncbi:MAG TPA: two-component regulator propeller domain-containing protein [Kofleriaceae bacterium]|nr:two-component regulator propeller domain-containing protein [Kofleriaceae bacterium]